MLEPRVRHAARSSRAAYPYPGLMGSRHDHQQDRAPHPAPLARAERALRARHLPNGHPPRGRRHGGRRSASPPRAQRRGHAPWIPSRRGASAASLRHPGEPNAALRELFARAAPEAHALPAELTLHQAAELLAASEAYVEELLARERLPHQGEGASLRVARRPETPGGARWARARRVGAGPQLLMPTSRRPRAPTGGARYAHGDVPRLLLFRRTPL